MKKIISSILLVIMLIISVSSWVIGIPKLRARKLYESEKFYNNACQLFSWLNSEGEKAVIELNHDTITYFTEDEGADLTSLCYDNVVSVIQEGIWIICYYDEIMELKFDETFSGKNFALIFCTDSEQAIALHSESCHPLGRYAIDDGLIIYVFFYEGYGGHWEILKQTLKINAQANL